MKVQKTLAEALLAAQGAISSIAKDGRNEYHKYDYVSAETMITECRKVLIDAGLLLTAGDVEVVPVTDESMIVRQTWVLAKDSLDDQFTHRITRDWIAVVSKGRPMDKALAGALTAGLSYTLRDLLLIPRGDEDGVGLNDTKRSVQEDQAPAPARSAQSKPRSAQSKPRPAQTSTAGGWSRGDRVETENGNVGEIFWIGAPGTEKADRVGVKWGDGDDELEWTWQRFLKAPGEGGVAGDGAGPPVDTNEIPF